MTDLTHERLRHYLHYDPETGVFTRAADSPTGRHKAGTRAGSRNDRYEYLWVEGKQYLAHRIAWFWMTGAWPSHQIDHINLDRFDNRWVNLREATISQNAMNRRPFMGRRLKGISFVKNEKKCGSRRWRASIMRAGQRYELGFFATPEEAHAAYCAAASALHREFARVA